MHTQLQRYTLALIIVIVASLIRLSVIPVLGYRYGFALFLIGTFFSGRFLGLGPSLFVLLVGSIPAISLHFIPASQPFDRNFQIATVAYFALGAMIVFLCQSEHKVRQTLQRQIAEREVVETELLERSQQLRLALEAGQLATWQLDMRTNKVRWCPRMEALHGYAPETFGGTLADALAHNHPEDQQDIMRQVGESPHEFRGTYRVLLEDGAIRWIEGIGRTLPDETGQPAQMLGVCMDVTEQKESEMALRGALEALKAKQEILQHTIEVQDHERRLIAYEIHDGIVQYATGALMQLEAMRDQSAAIGEKIDPIVGTLQRTVEEGRRLINGIRTPVLDDCGIVAAMEQLIDEEERAHVHVEFAKDNSLARLAPHIEEAFYRIAQEAFTNIRKHSKSKNVRVELERRGDQVHFEVQDWGVGFVPSEDAGKVHGLRGIKERARIVGGHCTIESAPGKGTRIAVDVPYSYQAENFDSMARQS